MIGDPLSRDQMSQLLHKMLGVEQPWTCCHGRPTLRHVSELLDVLKDDEDVAAEVLRPTDVRATQY